MIIALHKYFLYSCVALPPAASQQSWLRLAADPLGLPDNVPTARLFEENSGFKNKIIKAI